jgi:hypothetical protein
MHADTFHDTPDLVFGDAGSNLLALELVLETAEALGVFAVRSLPRLGEFLLCTGRRIRSDCEFDLE